MSIELKDDLPCMSPETARNAMVTYQRICQSMLDKNDIVNIQGKQYKKRSAYRKLARAFGISDEIVKEEHEGGVWRIHVRAFTANRSALGVGSCSEKERAFAHPDHDVYAIAHTRAKNRAIADLIGSGEVSAEEMDSKAYAEEVNAKAAKLMGGKLQ